jgi:hypothetical protein
MSRTDANKPSWFSSPPVGLQPLVIAVANLAPVIGVFYFDWEVFTILLLFWLENVIVGFFNVLKLRLVPPDVGTVSTAKTQAAGIPFFIMHYGMFMAGHGLFVVVMFLKPESPGDFVAAMAGRWFTLAAALLSLIAEHGYAYHFDFIRTGAYKKPSKIPQFMKPYGRLAIMHVTIILGGIGAQELGSPRPALLLLIGLKTLFDLGAWVIRLPSEGALGRIKGAFFRAAVGAVVGVWCCVMCFGLPVGLIGKAVSIVSRWLGGQQIGGDHWWQYGIGAGAVFAAILPAAVWWHHIMSGSVRYERATKLTKVFCVSGILALLFGSLAWPAKTGYDLVREQYKAARARPRAAANRPTGTAAPTQPQLPNLRPKSQPGTVNLIARASVSSSSDWESERGNTDFVAAKAGDGDRTTRWNSREGDASGSWLAVQWNEPVSIQQIVVREAFDRIADFVVETIDENDTWVPKLHVFGRRHISSFQWSTGGAWGYDPDRVHVDGRRLEDHKGRAFGQDHLGSVHPVFTINLPGPLTTTGLRLRITTTTARTVSIFEIEAY